MTPRTLTLALTAALMLPHQPVFAQTENEATAPVPRDDEWWTERHAEKLAERDDALSEGRRVRLVDLVETRVELEQCERVADGGQLRGADPEDRFEIGHRTVTVCHLANIARELARPLEWDPDRERFVDDPEADRLLVRPRRAGYELPNLSSAAASRAVG